MYQIMDKQIQQLHDNVNHAIIKCRGIYSQWAKKCGSSYNRMLASLNTMEERAAQIIGQERIRTMTALVMEYDQALATALGEMKL